jgi:hypothetical protein
MKSRRPDPTKHLSIDIGDKEELAATPHDSKIGISDISTFFVSNLRGQNDAMNEKREKIIFMIMTDKVNPDWYVEDTRWDTITNKLKSCLYGCRVLTRKGGRKYNYDYDIEMKGKLCKMEFKYNAESIKACPQWVSPMKPSQYLSRCYEDHHYDSYMCQILKLFNFNSTLPTREEYREEVHSPTYLKEVQDMYYQGCKGSKSKYTGNEDDILRYQEASRLANDSIQTFIQTAELNVEKLNEYLIQSQANKIYLIYHDGMFRLEERDIKDYTIEPSSIRKTNNSYEGTTVSGIKIKILLRWKNGKGIAYPAFQIT